MAIFSELRGTLDGLESRMGDVDIDVLLTAMRGLDDEAIVGAMAGAAAVANCAERMLTIGAGVVAERSRREAGHSGLAASRGHRNAVSLVQSIVGGTRVDAARAVRLGESLIEGADAATTEGRADGGVLGSDRSGGAGGWGRDDAAGAGSSGSGGWGGWGDGEQSGNSGAAGDANADGYRADGHGSDGDGGDGHGADGHGADGPGRDGHGADGPGADGHGAGGANADGTGGRADAVA